MRVRVDGVRDAVAASYALRRVDTELRREMTRNIRSVVNPMWQGAVRERGRTRTDQAVLTKGARVNAGARPTLVAASSRRTLRGGLVPRDEWQAFEFGATSDATTTYRRRSQRGNYHDVTRHTRRQLPPRYAGGRVLYKAVGAIGARVFSLWAQTAIRNVFDALEGRR